MYTIVYRIVYRLYNKFKINTFVQCDLLKHKSDREIQIYLDSFMQWDGGIVEYVDMRVLVYCETKMRYLG